MIWPSSTWHCLLSRPIQSNTVSPAMGARNQVGKGLLYWPASLWVWSLTTQFQTRFLESIPRPIAGLKFSTQYLYSINKPLHKCKCELYEVCGRSHKLKSGQKFGTVQRCMHAGGKGVGGGGRGGGGGGGAYGGWIPTPRAGKLRLVWLICHNSSSSNNKLYPPKKVKTKMAPR